MRPRRIEELLRERPPDEPPYSDELRLDGAGRSRIVSPVAGIALIVVAAIATAVAVVGPRFVAVTPPHSRSPIPSSSSLADIVPWIDAAPRPQPTPQPTQTPSSFDRCRADGLVMRANGWNGATGSLTADALLINIGRSTCQLTGKPSVQLVAENGQALTDPSNADRSAGAPIALAPGGSANTAFAWSNWCTDAPAGQLTLRLFLGDGLGSLSAEIRRVAGNSSPRCDLPRTGPTFSAIFPFHFLSPASAASASCSADQLEAFTGEWVANLGTSYSTLIVTNVPDRMNTGACSISNTPRLEFRDANGNLLLHSSGNPWPGQQVVGSQSTVATVIGLANWCGRPPTLPLTLDIVLDDGRVAVQPVLAAIPVPACIGDAGDAYVGYDRPLAAPGAYLEPEETGQAHDNDPLTVTIAVPAAIPGQSLDYTVTLAYAADDEKQVNFAADCPNYTERLSFADGRAVIESHALNCEPAGMIRRGGSVTFAMRLRIPEDAAVGTGELVWTLGDHGASAEATIEIGR